MEEYPIAWTGQFKGKEQKPAIVMEAIVDGELWKWHASVGHPGFMNDLNILDSSDTIVSIYRAHPLRRVSAQCFYLFWAIFMKTISQKISKKNGLYAAMQEALRKDVERAFGVLLNQFHILRQSAQFWCLGDNMLVLRACILLHNMCVEHRCDDYASTVYQRPCDDNTAELFGNSTPTVFQWTSSDAVPIGAPAGTWGAMAKNRHRESEDVVEHSKLK